MDCSDDGADVGEGGDVVTDEVVGDAVEDVYGGCRVGEIGCADFDGGGSRHNELQGGVRRVDAADADYGDFDRMRRLPYHA